MRRRGPRQSRAGQSTRTAFRTCPLCEAGCGLEITLRGRTDGEEVARIRGDRDDVFSKGYICPKGSTLKQLHEDPDRLRHAAREARRRVRGGRPGTRRSRRSSGGCCRSSRRTAATRCAVYLGNPNAHNLAGHALRPAAASGPSAPPTCSRPPRSTSGRRRSPPALMFGGGLNVPGARRRPHRPPAHARRQPVRVERQPGHRARLARPARARSSSGAAGSWSSTPAAAAPPRMADEWVPVRPGHRRLPADGDGAGAARARTSSTSATSATSSTGPRRGRRGAARPFTPEAVADVDRRRRRRHPAARPRARRRADAPCVYGRIGTTTAEFGTLTSLAGRRAQRPHRQPRPARRRHVHQGGGRRVEHPRHAALRPGRAPRTGATAGCGACPRRMGELPGGVPGRGDRHARARARSGRSSPSPATRCCPRPNAAGSTPRSPGLEFMVSVDIYVNETTRHADVILPAPSALQKGHYDLALLQLAPAQRRQLQSEPVLAARRGPARRVGGARPPRADAPGHGRRRRPGRWSTT